jgi:hypothetical protein
MGYSLSIARAALIASVADVRRVDQLGAEVVVLIGSAEVLR